MMKRSRRLLFGIGIAVTGLGMVAQSPAAEAKGGQSAKINVTGMGWWDSREQRISLNRLLGDERGETLDANAIEDAVFLLLSSLGEQGYLEPTIEALITAPDGKVMRMTYDSKLESFLPRSVVAKAVLLKVTEGVRFVFDEVHFSGLQVLQEDVARQFFVGEPVLISRKAARVYSPSKLRHAMDNVEQELRRLGYAEARVTAKDVKIDRATGKVQLEVAVEQGARWLVTSVRLEGAEGEGNKIPSLQNFIGQAWSPLWQQNVSTELRNHFWHLGFPDVSVQIQPDAGEARAGIKAVAVIARVTPGEAVKVGPVQFSGANKTSEAVLRRRVAAKPGQPLDLLAMEQARFRLARLGIFDAVDLRYEPETGPQRSPIFHVRERRRSEVNLLLGYGSYEQLRGGVEWRQWNLFGRAHQSRLLLLQSMKSSRGEYTYTVPELFGESLDGTARLFGLERQETSFLRQEFGGSFAVSTPVKWLGANASLGYTYQSLRNRDNTLATRSADESQVNAASVDLNLVRDRRDNPLRPRRGYRWFLQTETASQLLGGSVDYQRIEFGGSYHAPWGQGRWVHVGLNHGIVTTIGTNDATLPVNKRFFPGGDNSIRGYQDGEATPIDADGKFVGAKSYLLLNLELEQALTNKWSAVLFGDALGTAVRLADYPFAEKLYSVGIGLRYQTIIGPLRVEYGRNLDPRPRDPSGSLLFSVGFPF